MMTCRRVRPHRHINDMKLAFWAMSTYPMSYHGYNMAQWKPEPDKPGVAWGHPEVVSADVAAILPSVDHVIVVLHSGYEYKIPPSPAQRDAAHAAIDAGATLVIGHPPIFCRVSNSTAMALLSMDWAISLSKSMVIRDGHSQCMARPRRRPSNQFIPALIQVGVSLA